MKINHLFWGIIALLLPYSLHSQSLTLLSQNGKVNFCEGDSLLLTASTSAWAGTLTYSWYADNTFIIASADSIFFAKNTGLYKVEVNNGIDTLVSDSLQLTERSENATVEVIDSINCAGGNNGSLSANVINGSGTYLYAWTHDGSSSQSVSGLFSGIYTCEITDLVYGCIIRAGNLLTEPAPLNINFTGTSPSSGQGDGSVTALVLGGTPPYFYTWNSLPTQYTATATNLLAGTYTLNLQDSHGCTSIQQVNISLLGIFAALSESNISLYPNPTNQFIYLKNLPVSDCKLFIYNNLGDKIWEGFANENKIDVSQLSNGIYRLCVEMGTKHWTSSFFIQR